MAEFIHLPITLDDDDFQTLEDERERKRRPDGVKCHKSVFYGKILKKEAKRVRKNKQARERKKWQP